MCQCRTRYGSYGIVERAQKRGLGVLIKVFSTIVIKDNLNIVLLLKGTEALLDRFKASVCDLRIWERTVFLGPVSGNMKECLYRIPILSKGEHFNEHPL